MSERILQYSPGAVAELLGVPIEAAKLAIAAAGLRDDRGRIKTWFSAEDLEPIRTHLGLRQLRGRRGFATQEQAQAALVDRGEAVDVEETATAAPPPRRRRKETTHDS